MSFRPSHATSQPGTALHWAVARNSEVAARVLVRLGANPYLPNKLNRTPWDLAVGARLVKLLRIFETEHRCDIESERREFTRQCLVNNSVAVRLSTGMHHDRRNAETFAFLLESGATTVREILMRLISPGSMDSTLLRPFIEIHKEELSSQPSLVHELLRRAVATCTDSVLQEILSLLHRPIVISEIIYLLLHCNILSRGPPEGTAEVLSSLLRIFGAYSDFNINTKYKCRVDLVESNDFSEISLTLGEGTTLLHQAFSLGRIDLAEILLDHEADPGVLDESGATPLGRMIFAGSQHSNQMLKSLLGTPGMRTPSEFPSSYPEFVLQHYMTLPSRGQNIFHQITRGWESGRVHGSATHSKEALVSLINYFEARNPDLLIELLNSPDKYGGTPLFYAVKNGYYSAVMVLNKHGADPLIPSDTALEEEVDNRRWDDIFVLESWIDPTGVVAQKLKKDFEERTRLTRQTIKKSIENERVRRLAHEPV